MCELPFNYSMADGLLYIARLSRKRCRYHNLPSPRLESRAAQSADSCGVVTKCFTFARGLEMSAIAAAVERPTGRVDDQGLLFEYTIKLVLFVGFFELVLYRLVSRLGMHISKIAAQHGGLERSSSC